MSDQRTKDKFTAKSSARSEKDLQKVSGGIIFVGGDTASKPAAAPSEGKPVELSEQDLKQVSGGVTLSPSLEKAVAPIVATPIPSLPVNTADGSQGGNTTGGWDIAKNKVV